MANLCSRFAIGREIREQLANGEIATCPGGEADDPCTALLNPQGERLGSCALSATMTMPPAIPVELG